MLSSKVLNISCLLKNSITCPDHLNFLSTSSMLLNFTNNKGEGIQEKERKLTEWREPLLPPKNSKEKEKILYEPDKGFFGVFRAKFPLTPWGIKEYRGIVNLDKQRQRQEINKLNAQMVGFELASAYFLISIGGKVKFKGQNEWLSMQTDKIEDILPTSFDVNYIVEEIDVSDILLFYEALENFQNVTRIKRAIFKNSPLLNDWFMDKISTIFPRLEYLDVSNCPKLTERGLEGLYRTSTLQKLIITNYRKSAAFELTCAMLEDCLPNLQIEILDPPSNPPKSDVK